MSNNCCGARGGNESNSSCGCGDVDENKMCKLTKPHNEFDVDEIVLLTNDPKYICSCCGRVANEKENLCNPIGLK
ncbi:hypothetical protein ACFL08_05665 [Patescibacteria group bacterium]